MIDLETLREFGYESFFDAFKAAKENPQTRNSAIVGFRAVRPVSVWDENGTKAERFQIDVEIDYIKARAFEELLDQLPSEDRLSAALQTVRAFLPEHGATMRTLKTIPTKWKETL